jgi:DNA (cytosine-5)-methyltransferase 1
MFRAIQEIHPRWIVGENVLGLLNWNGGMVFDDVCVDLETEGYYNSISPSGERKVYPIILPACGVNARHQRYRVWFIAHTANAANERLEGSVGRTSEGVGFTKRSERDGNAAYANIKRQQGQGWPEGQGDTKTERDWKEHRTFDDGGRLFESPLCSGNDGLPAKLDGITVSGWRKQSLMSAGNAVVPQVVYEIFKSIELYEKKKPS